MLMGCLNLINKLIETFVEARFIKNLPEFKKSIGVCHYSQQEETNRWPD